MKVPPQLIGLTCYHLELCCEECYQYPLLPCHSYLSFLFHDHSPGRKFLDLMNVFHSELVDHHFLQNDSTLLAFQRQNYCLDPCRTSLSNPSLFQHHQD